MICNPCISSQAKDPTYEYLCASCVSDCNSCNTCQSGNTGSTVCDTEQTYDKTISICTTNKEYISYEESWKPIIDAINEIYDYEHGDNMEGTKTITSKITVTDDTNLPITLDLYKEAQERLKTTVHNKNDIMLGTYFKDLTDALKNNKYSDTLCESCNTSCNSCDECQTCNGACQDEDGLYCTACNSGEDNTCSVHNWDESYCIEIQECVN